MMYIGDLHYNSLELYQYATRTAHNMEESEPAGDGEAVKSEEAESKVK